MKIIHRFLTLDKTYEISEIIEGDFTDLRGLSDSAIFKGVFWDKVTAESSSPHLAVVCYRLADPNGLNALGGYGTILGPRRPMSVDCDCGSDFCGHPGHSTWCGSLSDGWDEAIKLHQETQDIIEEWAKMSLTAIPGSCL